MNWPISAKSRISSKRLVISRRDSVSKLLCGPDGMYEGGATARVEWMLPVVHRRMALRGEVPALAGLEDQTLRVVADGVELAEHRLAAGDFDIEVELPPPPTTMSDRVRSPLIELRAGREIDATSVGLPSGRRRVSYVLREVAGLP